MRLIVSRDLEEAARCAAGELARTCAAAVAERGRACIALSGGRSPLRAFELFACSPLPWESIVVAQVDERCVPADDSRRNLAPLKTRLVEQGRLPRANLLAMPVERGDLEQAAHDYAALLRDRLGPGGEFDVVQLGLGPDGHTASLVPGDPVLEVGDRDVAITQPYQGTRRMTLTYARLQSARERLWLVTGADKAAALAELLAGVGTSPAVRLNREPGVVVADRAAAPQQRGS
ncbi:MAG TPA: 6-phosphogluconolactonase [Steroidobacteraceae bacterium]|nr:6-phosphogluconolactonase [Steroidobacteraceae bacterium]